VRLWTASLPYALGALASHHWFAVYDPAEGRWRRWEVWQSRGAGGTSWGHVHLDLMRPDSPVGGGPARVAAEWRGQAAEAIRAVLENPEAFPHRDRYRYWPGPNSNTYVEWVLRSAGVACDLGPRAIGRSTPRVRAQRVNLRGSFVLGVVALTGLTATLAFPFVRQSAGRVPPFRPQPPAALVRRSVPLRQACREAGVGFPPPRPKVEIRKGARTLALFSGGTLLKEYPAALGGAPVGDKERQGDGRTPVGEFYVCTRLEKSRFHRFLGLSYPAPVHARAALQSRRIDSATCRLFSTPTTAGGSRRGKRRWGAPSASTAAAPGSTGRSDASRSRTTTSRSCSRRFAPGAA